MNCYLENLEGETFKLRTQIKRLCQENAWLRDELGSTQKKLHECEEINAVYAVEIEQLTFFKHMKISETTDDSLYSEEISTENLVNELFPFDENDDDDQLKQETVQHCSDTFNTHSFSTTINGYEIPSRLKTLHNLVIQYASEGRYEVAVPLCRQALEDLEKTSGHQRKRFNAFLCDQTDVFCCPLF